VTDLLERLRKRVTRSVAIAIAIVVGIVIVLLITDQEQALVIGVITGAAYGMVALGLVLIYKSSGVFNFAQGEFGTVAVYALWLLHTNDIPYPFALVGSLIAAIVMGLVVEFLIVRPLFDAPRVTLLVATAGVALLAIGVQIWFGEATGRRIEPAFPTLDRISVLGIQVSDQRLLLMVVLLGLGALLALFFNRTNLGLAILGASQEPTATELVGISVRRLSGFTWALAALLGGLAGVLAVPINQNFTPGILTGGFLIPGFTAAVLGGMTSLPGAFVGGITVGVVQSVATNASLFADIPGTPGTLMVFIVLLAVLAIRPQGLLGKAA
jgi:branched-chain amino acid transport system permease protein